MKQINVKLLAILAITAVVLLLSVKFLHDFQAVRGAGQMLVRAEQAKEEGKYEEAVKLLQGYISRRPKETEQYSNLAITMKKAVEQAKEDGRVLDRRLFHSTYGWIEKALRESPNDDVLREAAVDFAMRFGRWTDVVSHIEFLEKKNGKLDPEMSTKLARCQLFSGKDDVAVETLAKMVGFDPMNRTFDASQATAVDHTPAYTILASIYAQKRDRGDVAKQIFEQLIATKPDDPQSFLDRANFLRRGTEEDKSLARKDIAKAMSLAPDNADALVSAGQLALDDKDFSRAKSLYEKALTLDSKNVHALLGLSMWGGATRDIDAAVRYLKQAEEIRPQEPGIVLQRANLEIDRGNFEEVETAIARLKELNHPRPFRDFLRGRIHLQKGEWLRASEKLSAARPHLAQERPELLTPVDSALAMCYENLSQNDLRKDAFQEILLREPNNVMARWGKIEALRALKRTDAALDEYALLERQLEHQPNTAGRLLIPQLTLELMQQRNRPEDDRDWSEAETLVRRILQETRVNDAAKASVVAQYYTEIGEEDKAKALLQKTRDKNPDNLVLKLSKVGDLASTDRVAARKLLDEFQAEHGDMASVRLLRAQMALADRSEGFEDVIRQQAENASMFPENDRLRLWARVGRMLIMIGDRKGAGELWQRVADAQQDNIQIRIGIFELALQEGDAAGRAAALKQLRELVGERTAEMKWARAMQLLWDVKRKDRPVSDLEEARALVDDAINSRPGWEQLYRLSGELALREDQPEQALDQFKMALELGATSPELYRNIAVLSFSNNDPATAREYLDKLPKYMWSKREQQMDLELLAKSGNLPDDIPFNEESTDPQDHYFAGRILGSAGRLDEADAAYRRALKLAPNRGDFWGGLYNLYVDNKKLDAAKAVLASAESKLPAKDLPMFLGTAYRRVGDWEKSESNYLAAAELEPKNSKILFALSEMYLVSNQFDKAKQSLERMIAQEQLVGPSEAARIAWARRRLAGIVASDGTYQGYQRALELLKANQGDAPTMTPQDLVVMGQMVAGRPDSDSRQQVMELIERTGEQRPLSALERFQLATLYESEGRWSDCKSEMERLLTSSAANEGLMETWLNWLVKHDELDRAATWVRKVPKNSQMAIRTKAHIDVSRGQSRRAVATLSQIVPKALNVESAPSLRYAAILAEELAQKDSQLFKLSDKLWTRYAKISPELLLDYAKYLARRNTGPKLVQSLKVCDQIRKNGNYPAAIQTATGVLRKELCPERAKYAAVVRGWSDTALKSNPELSMLYVIRSELEDVLGDQSGSQEWLRKFLELGIGNVQERGIVSNNLAYKLALEDKGDEAIQHAQNAMDLLGPQNALKDTFGMAYLAQKDYEKSTAEFESAIAVSPDASKYYHLALARWRSGDREAGAVALETAIDMGVEKAMKDGPEHDKLMAFIAELQSAGAISAEASDSDIEEMAPAQ